MKKSLKLFYFLLVFLFFISVLNVDSFSQKKLNFFIWKVIPLNEKIDSKNASYFIGTIHLYPDLKIQDKVLNLLKDCKTFVTEVDLKNVNFNQLIYREKEEQNIKNLLNKEYYDKLLKLAQDIGLNEETLMKFKYWYLLQVLNLSYLDSDKFQLMDSILSEYAEKFKLKIEFLETIEEQFKALESSPLKEQVNQFIDFIDNPQKSRESLKDIFSAYARGDEKSLISLFFNEESMKKYPEFYKKVFFERNNKWLPLIEKFIGNGKSFIAVGLGHLIGKDGIMEILKNKGYKVERLIF